MQYAYGKVGKIINSITFFFEEGDDEIAIETFKVISTLKRPPTSIVRDGSCLSISEVLYELRAGNISGDGIGVRFMADDDQSLRKCLDLFRNNYPVLSSLADEIEDKILGQVH